MKRLRLIIILLFIILFCSGCLFENKEQMITVQKWDSEEEIYNDFKKITVKKQVQQAIEIVENADWEIEKEEMAGNAEYQFQFQSKNGDESKVASYLLWISSNSENLEITTDSNKVAELTKQDSAGLYRIVTQKEFIK